MLIASSINAVRAGRTPSSSQPDLAMFGAQPIMPVTHVSGT